MHVFRSARLDRAQRVAGAFIGRGTPDRPDPASLLHHMGRSASSALALFTLRQIHSGRYRIIDHRSPGTGGVAGDGDALLTSRPGIALGIATADCLPIAAFDPEAPALAVVHAGWRGTAQRILENALVGLRESTGASPDRMEIVMGPGARVCCYQVGRDVAEAFERSLPGDAPDALIDDATEDGRYRLDLVEANRAQAVRAGVDPGRIEVIDVCSIHRPETCHSYRRDGSRAGRMWLLAVLE